MSRRWSGARGQSTFEFPYDIVIFSGNARKDYKEFSRRARRAALAVRATTDGFIVRGTRSAIIKFIVAETDQQTASALIHDIVTP